MESNQWRYVNLVLGVWLFISAFIWTHSHAQFVNTWILGIIVAASALIALSNTSFRYVNTVAGIWLVLTAFAMPRAQIGTLWNNVIVGALVFLASLPGVTRSHIGLGARART